MAEEMIKALKELGIYNDVLKNAVLTIRDKYKNNELPVNEDFPDDLDYANENNKARFSFLIEFFSTLEKLENNEEVPVEKLESIVKAYVQQSKHNCFNPILGNERFKKALSDRL